MSAPRYAPGTEEHLEESKRRTRVLYEMLDGAIAPVAEGEPLILVAAALQLHAWAACGRLAKQTGVPAEDVKLALSGLLAELLSEDAARNAKGGDA